MEKLIDSILLVVYLAIASAGGHFTLRQVAAWSQKVALQKAAQGLGRLEPVTQKMTGGKLDF